MELHGYISVSFLLSPTNDSSVHVVRLPLIQAFSEAYSTLEHELSYLSRNGETCANPPYRLLPKIIQTIDSVWNCVASSIIFMATLCNIINKSLVCALCWLVLCQFILFCSFLGTQMTSFVWWWWSVYLTSLPCDQ